MIGGFHIDLDAHILKGEGYQVTFVFLLPQAEIINNPELFIEPDPELPLALLDQKEVRTPPCFRAYFDKFHMVCKYWYYLKYKLNLWGF